MDVAASFWSLVLLIICIKGIRRIGLWEGSKSKKDYYRIFLPIFAFITTIILGVYLGYQQAYVNPLFYMLAITVILHLVIKRPAQIWVKSGILPFSSEYPTKEKKEWKDMIYHERLFLIGVLISSFSFEFSISEVTYFNIVRLTLFWIGIFAIASSISLKYSEVRLFIGFISLIFSTWLFPLHKINGTILFWIGVGFLVWSYFTIKKKRIEKSVRIE